MDPQATPNELYGLLAEFNAPEPLVAAARRAREAGYRRLDGYTPFPVPELSPALGLKPTRIPLATFLGGLIGGTAAYAVLYYSAVISYPLNVGGRSLHSWPAFIPITFEMTVLGAAFAAFLGMLAGNRLPQPYHPLFGVPEFSLATRSRFFLCVQASDALFDRGRTRQFLEDLGATVHEVPR